ncbi:TnsD family Tn7-like transposition protein [Flavobacterium sp.]|uniref:TnsD family Tn7-like transposition protein n=1 Tax=Flavobacterium sp. TaxID=239 RepID=UPI002604E2A0|nr:TnsD family Tn7-like transposition protein [Flavobacterium sp.]
METSNLSYFPAPVDGETVYSWLSRYHLWAGHNSFRKHSLALFGVNTAQAAAEFPCFLRTLSQKTGVDVDWIINHMVDVAFYKPFLTEFQYSALLNSLRVGKTTSLQTQLGMIANRITPGRELYWCPKCVECDLEKRGFPFWHVEHQIVGLLSCPIHKMEFVSLKKIRSQAILPTVSDFKYVNDCIDGFSNLVHDEFLSPQFLNKPKVTWAYLARLDELGLLTSSSHLRLESIKNLVRTELTKFGHYTPFQQLLLTIEKQYPECLFYNSTAQHHPIKHLFFIYVLFGSWQNFENYYHCAQPIVRQHPAKCELPPMTLSSSAKEKLVEGASLRNVSESTGISVTTLKILAQQQSIDIDTRPQKIFRFVERDIWRKLFVGGSCVDIANEFEISVSAVEHILRKHQYLKPLRKRIWFYREQREHRELLTQYFLDNPLHTRKQFRAANSASYMWLYRHDKEWLEQHSPEKVTRRYWPR